MMKKGKPNQGHQENRENELLRQIVCTYMEQQGDGLAKLAAQAAEDPACCAAVDTHRDWFLRELKRADRRKMLRHARKFLKAAVVIVAIATFSFMVPFVTVEGFRDGVVNLMLDVHKRYTNVLPRFTQRMQEKIERGEIPETEGYGLPTWVPEGFVMTGKEEWTDEYMGENWTINYEAEDGRNFFYQRWPFNTLIDVDTENADKTEILTVNGAECFLTVKGEWTSLVWFDTRYSYIVMGSLTEEEVIKIVENLEKSGESCNILQGVVVILL